MEKCPLPWHGQGRLLDFGCGSGEFLRLMSSRGWSVTGLDSSSRAVDRIRQELGLNALVGSLPHLDLEPESFDVITMWHALEHVHEPVALLREARKLLAPGGKLVIAVPNIDSWPFRWFGRHWYGLDLPRHLTHFTAASLLQMLQRSGFATEPVRYTAHGDWLRRSARAAMGLGPLPPWLRLLAWRFPARLVAAICAMAEQSDGLLVIANR